jgi:glycerol-3-phosphate dehydrogenase
MQPADKASPLNDLKSSYDIIVLGGGIQGATLSWIAACQGYSVVLIEQNDFGSGVSANSLKIIHGGIRYLQGLDFFRMRRSMGERRMLMQLAPLLVHPMRCVLPAYDGGRGKGRLALALGSMIYDILTMDRNKGLEPAKRIRRSRVLSPAQIKKLLAGLDHSETAGGISWWDAMVYDSERLVLGFVMSARQNGADVCNHVRAEEILTAGGRVQGLIAGDLLTGDRLELHGRVVMDCTGPWSALGGSKPDQHYAKAMNLLLQKPLASCAFGARSKKKSDGMLFFVPWKNGTIAGTWYSHADKNSPNV